MGFFEMITGVDLSILRYIHDNLRFPVLNELMWFFTHLAEPFMCPIYPLIFIIIGLAVYYKRFKAGTLDERWRDKFDFAKLGLLMGVALIFGLIVCNFTLKPLIARIRPYEVEGFADLLMIERQGEKSFPSGHSVAVFEMAFAASWYCVKKDRAKWSILAYALAVVIAYSRIYVGVHYPTDVLAGALIGTLCGALAVYVVNLIYKKWIDPKIYPPYFE